MGDEARTLESGRGSPKGQGLGKEALPRSNKSSELTLAPKVRCDPLRRVLADLREVLLGTKLSPLLLAVPLAAAARCYHLGNAWVFGLSLLGLAPLAERVSFLSEQITYHTSPTVAGLLNATCGNVPELIIALLALKKDKIGVLKWSLFGSILSNMLLVLGSSLFCGGLVNHTKEQPLNQQQADVSISLLLLSALCHILALMYRHTASSGEYAVGAVGALELSRFCSIVMLLAYFTCLFFQLKTHCQSFQTQEDESNGNDDFLDAPMIGFRSAFAWLIGMTVAVAVLSDYVVGTIEATSESWGMSVSFISVILIPLGGNAAEHASAIIFALKNKIDVTLGVTLGSATQIALFVTPLCVLVAWMKGVNMDLDFKLLETGSFVIAILMTASILRDGTWHYMKGATLLFCYLVISALFFSLGTSESGKCHQLECQNGTNKIVKA